MKLIVLAVMFLAGCATVNPHAYNEAGSCPAEMDRDQYMSGAVRCQAMCGSYGRGFEAFDLRCRCICKPEKPNQGGATL